MARITHCGSSRVAESFWLHSNVELFLYQQLLYTTCPACKNFVMEWIGMFPDGRRGGSNRIASKHHEEWIRRTHRDTGDLAKGVDSSLWDPESKGIYWVYGSLSQFPYTYGRRKVQ